MKASPTIPTKGCPPACSKPGLSSSTATACGQRMIAAVTTPMSGTRGTMCRAGGAGEGRAALGPWGRKGRNLICMFVLFVFLLGGRVEKNNQTMFGSTCLSQNGPNMYEVKQYVLHIRPGDLLVVNCCLIKYVAAPKAVHRRPFTYNILTQTISRTQSQYPLLPNPSCVRPSR